MASARGLSVEAETLRGKSYAEQSPERVIGRILHFQTVVQRACLVYELLDRESLRVEQLANLFPLCQTE